MKRASIALALFLVVAVVAGVVLTRESTLVWAAHKLEQRTNGAIVLAQPSGSLLGHIHLAQLKWSGELLEIAAEDVDLGWAPWWLLAGKVAFRHADAASVSIVRKPRPPDHARGLPPSLDLPVRLRFERVRTAALSYAPEPGNTYAFGHTAFDVDFGSRNWSLDLKRLDTLYGTLSGSAAMEPREPYRTHADLKLVHAGVDAQHSVITSAKLTGVLTLLDVDAQLRAPRSNVRAQAQVAPLEPQPLRRVDATLAALDPNELGRALPSALIAGSIKADTGADGVLRGRIDLANREPGTIDAKRIPVTALTGGIATEPGRWQAQDLVIVLGEGGRLQGSAWLAAHEAGAKLTGEAIDLHVVHAAMRPTRLAAKFSTEGPFEAQHVQLEAKDRNLQVALDAIAGTERIEIKQARAKANGGTATVKGTLATGGDHAFALTGTLARFDPSAWGAYPKANLNASLSAKGAVLPVLQVQGSGRLAPSTLFGHPASGKGTFASRGIDSPAIALDVAAAIGATRLGVKGTVEDPKNLKTVDLNLSLAGESMADLYPITGLPYPETAPYSVSGRLGYRERVWSFRGFRGQVGRSDLEGDFVADLSQERPKMTGDLTSRRLDIKDLAGFIGAGPRHPRDANRVLSQRPFDLRHLNAADADIRFNGRSIRNERLPLRAMTAHLVLDRGRLTVQPLQFRAAGGEIDARIDMDARTAPIHTVADVQMRGLRLNALAPGVKALMTSTGVLQGRTRLDMHGNSVAAMLASADGDLVLAMNGGAVSDVALRLANLDIANTLAAMARGNRSVAVNCVVADFTANDGVLEPRTLVLDSEHTVIHGDGHIDLRDERLALTLKADPKDGSLLALRGPIRIDGVLARPAVHPDLKSTLLRSGLAAALATLAPPLAIVPFLERGKNQKVDCEPLIVEANRFVRTGEKSAAAAIPASIRGREAVRARTPVAQNP